MASFLARHQTLRCLYLSAQTYSFLPTTSSVTAHLPNLEHYEGPALLVPALRLSTTKLRSTRLRWAAMHKSSIDGIVRALHASTTSDGGPFIFSHRCLVTNTRADYMAILVSVARYMPHIGTLQICVDHVVPIGQDAVEKITEHLPRFDRLQYISFVVMRRVVPPEPNRAELGGGLPHPHGLPSPWVRVAETGRSLGNV
ncbi:hypothetical protein FB45DRAFT_939934 [Roridomyces roridus]|uniref:Uncharacterized protein n=1 Tax=Roridomyces roridus TaxID=1738132 RepID=A0AAD7FCK1_9AGAR|nr:hypothetical protein FB45DRAFT_939934 [Roridomyces roridus]